MSGGSWIRLHGSISWSSTVGVATQRARASMHEKESKRVGGRGVVCEYIVHGFVLNGFLHPHNGSERGEGGWNIS